ncbi:hypothetical protein LPJ73_003422 [Coemansia sp. RSA 2703]|nr:hypothetical protein LPJ73_003422 [Coemansia sp. RSA 2703]KAJ2376752.1 hypothetical protein IW150_001788 [Coemansia sp. RSA 2607]KAJ2393782.1 hypothetical protein GGI05_002329 [Coemansia sp. RSA 2603]
MSTVYTLVKPTTYTPCALVYAGSAESKSWKTALQEPPLYEINFRGRYIELRQTISESTTTVVLKGEYHGLTRSSATIEGFNSSASAKRRSKLKYGWSFVDFNSNEFQWFTTVLGHTYTLRDGNNKEVAKFVLRLRDYRAVGTLTILEENMPEQLLALVMLTCKIVHNNMCCNDAPVASTSVVVTS